MERWRTITICVGLATIAGAIYYASTDQESDRQATTSTDRNEPKSKTSASDITGAPVPRQVSPTISGEAESPPTPPNPEAAEDLVAEPAPPPPPEQSMEVARRLKEVVSSEQRDSQWSSATESAMQDAFASLDEAKLNLESIECASTLCELTIGPGGSDFDAALNQLQRKEPFNTSGFFYYDPKSERISMFVGRAGHPLSSNAALAGM